MGGLGWRGDGRLFAVGGNDHRIYVWDMATDRLQSVLEGHQNSVVGLQFTHEGGLLISSSWDGTLRVWDPVRGTNLVTVPAGLIRIGPDDRQVALREQRPARDLGACRRPGVPRAAPRHGWQPDATA